MSTRSIPRRASWFTVVIVAAIALGGCDRGDTAGATHVTNISATLHGTVQSDEPPTHHWFEYDPQPQVVGGVLTFDHSTPEQQPACCDPVPEASATVSGLAPDTTYQYRFCIRTESGSGLCGAPDAFTTRPADRDVVQGELLYRGSWSAEAVAVSVRAEPDSSVPVGRASHLVAGGVVVFTEAGEATCLRISGNRAVVGFAAEGGPEGQVFPRAVYVEDNGPGGDRFGFEVLAEVPASCPDPATFGGNWLTSIEGDVTITDHDPPG